MNWVDLETEYFNVLLATKDSYKGPGQFKEIQKVNDQLDFLKSKLEEYLEQQQMIKWENYRMTELYQVANLFNHSRINHSKF